MMKLLEVGAFALLIGGQFLAALVSTARRSSLYPPVEGDHRPSTQVASETNGSVSREHSVA